MLMVNHLCGFGSGGSVMPQFVAAGAGAQNVGGASVDVPFPSGIVAAQLLILHVAARDGSFSALIDTPSGWTAINSGTTSAGSNLSAVFYKIATGSESGNQTVTGGGDIGFCGRMYSFKNNAASGTPYENAAVNTTGTGTTLSQLSIAGNGENRLCLHLTTVINSTTVTAFTGESGGDFTETVAEYAPTALTLQLQSADLITAGTISGGSATLGASSARVRHVIAVLPS